MASSAQEFLAALDAHRDALFSRARAAAPSDAAAESALLAALHRAFAAALAGAAPMSAMNAQVPVPAAPVPDLPMPADTYARLVAAIQVDAAGSGTGTKSALNPDHVLLSPDPLLAPRRSKRPREPVEGFGFSPMARFIVASALALIAAVIVTTALVSWRDTPRPAPATPASPPDTAHTAPRSAMPESAPAQTHPDASPKH